MGVRVLVLWVGTYQHMVASVNSVRKPEGKKMEKNAS